VAVDFFHRYKVNIYMYFESKFKVYSKEKKHLYNKVPLV
jgi:hypothetical protein